MSQPAPGQSTNGAGANGSAAGDTQPPMRLGGMAMRNGLLVHGPSSWAAAARNASSGSIDVASGPKPDFGGNRAASVPFLRGPLRMAEAFAVIPIARRALPAARLPFEDPRVLAAAAGVSLINGALRRRGGRNAGTGTEAASVALGLLPALVALSGSELAAYHGVEHKAIAAYEQGSRDPSTAAKEHQRCGSNLIAPLMVFTIAGQALIERLPNKPGQLARLGGSIGSLSLAVEVFAYAERHPDSPLGRAVHASGDAIQRLFATREPNEEQIEVGVAAMDAILAAESAA
ncbi:MAG: DUF1385 domain-containing protein [Solirubrobacterales bacterium]